MEEKSVAALGQRYLGNIFSVPCPSGSQALQTFLLPPHTTPVPVQAQLEKRLIGPPPPTVPAARPGASSEEMDAFSILLAFVCSLSSCLAALARRKKKLRETRSSGLPSRSGLVRWAAEVGGGCGELPPGGGEPRSWFHCLLLQINIETPNSCKRAWGGRN